MEPGRKSILRTVINTARAHVRETFRTIGENATQVAEDEYGVKLDLAKPKLKKIVDDLKKWNENRKEESRLSREELKEVVHGVVSETKRALVNPDEIGGDSDLDDFNDLMDSLGDDLEDDVMDFGVESVSSNRNDLPEVELIQPTDKDIALFCLGILMSVQKNTEFTAYINNNIDDVKEILNIDESDSNDINEVVSNNLEGISPEEEVYSEQVVDEVEDSQIDLGLSVAMNAEELTPLVGMESEAYKNNEEITVFIMESVLPAYQRNDIFMLTLDKVMTRLNKVISNFEADIPEENRQGLNILFANHMLYQASTLFNFNILDSVSFFAIFTLFEESETDYIEILTDAIVKLSNNLDGVAQIIE